MPHHAEPALRQRWKARIPRDVLPGAVATAAALAAAAWLLPGLHLEPRWVAVPVAVGLAVADLVLRPVLRLLATRAGAVAAVLTGILVQLVLVQTLLSLAAGGSRPAPGTTVAVLVLVVAVRAVTRWLALAGGHPYLVANLLRQARARRRAPPGATPRTARSPAGLVIVQVDGLSFPVLRRALESGALPTLSRWISTGTRPDVVPWWARVPATTPASQAALLHGTSDGIAAFRWYEKEAGRFMVANRPADAAEIEARVSDGRGLLAAGGVSVSNLFTGDAPTTRLVVSRRPRGAGAGSGAEYLGFFGSLLDVTRVAVLTLLELAKALHRSGRKRLRHAEPSVRRGLPYALLLGLTNTLLRDLDVVLVAQHMIRGAPVIYVTFVDYDEIAHQVGLERPECVTALAGLDRVLATFEQVAADAPRDYRFVVLSDHGQSEGATFRELAGRTLEDAVRAHAGFEREDGHRGDGRPPVVAASGNLGLVWFPELRGRACLDGVRRRYPGLIPGLLSEPGVAFVVAHGEGGPVAIGAHGEHSLADGRVEGEDPLVPFGVRAAGDLARLAAMPSCPDLVVHSTVERGPGEVHAFEDLVGSHGGLGGGQNQAVLVHPSDWPVDDDLLDRSVPGEALLYGAEAVHHQLVRWLERCGARPRSGASRSPAPSVVPAARSLERAGRGSL